MDGGAGGGGSGILVIISFILSSTCPFTSNAPMTTQVYSSITWVPLTQELRGGIEFAKVSDRPSQYQVSFVQFLATLSLCSHIKELQCPKGQSSYPSTKHFTLEAIPELSGPEQCPFPQD